MHDLIITLRNKKNLLKFSLFLIIVLLLPVSFTFAAVDGNYSFLRTNGDSVIDTSLDAPNTGFYKGFSIQFPEDIILNEISLPFYRSVGSGNDVRLELSDSQQDYDQYNLTKTGWETPVVDAPPPPADWYTATSNPEWVTFTFDDPQILSSSTDYYIVVHSSSTGSSNARIHLDNTGTDDLQTDLYNITVTGGADTWALFPNPWDGGIYYYADVEPAPTSDEPMMDTGFFYGINGTHFTGQGYPLIEYRYNETPDQLVVLISEISSGAPDVKPFGFQLKKNGNFIECLTDIRTANNWSIPAKPSFTSLVMDLHGADCNPTIFSSGEFSVFSVSATNTNTSQISTEVEWYGYGGFGIALFSEENPYLDLGGCQNCGFTTGEEYDYSKYVNILLPADNQITPTTTTISVEYALLPTLDPIDAYVIRYDISDALTGVIEYTFENEYATNTAVNVTITEDVELTTGSKKIEAYFANDANYIISQVDIEYFHVNENTYFIATGIESPYSSAGDLTQNDCNTFDVGCQFQQAMLFLFKPSQASYNAFIGLQNNLSQRVPFVYYTLAREKLETISIGSGSLANYEVTIPSLGTITIVNWAAAASAFGGAHVTTMNTVIEYAIYFLFLVYAYRKILSVWSPSS